MKTNGKFKVIAVVLTAVMLLSVMSMSAFAAAITYSDVAGVESGDDYEVTVTYNAADVAEGDYVTVLVTVDSADLIFAEGDTTSPTNVIYVDQKAVTAGEGTFVFKVAKDIVANKDVFVKLGATNQATAAAGNKKFEVTTPGGDKLEVETSTDVLFGDMTSVIVKPVTPVADGKAVFYDGKPMMYTKYIVDGKEVVKYIALVASFDKDKLTVEDGTMKQVVYGNINDDTEVIIDGADAAVLMQMIVKNAETDTDLKKLVSDLNGDGIIDGADAAILMQLIVKNVTVPPVATK